MRYFFVLAFCAVSATPTLAQWSADAIHSDFVLQNRRSKFKDYLYHQSIDKTFNSVLDSTNQFDFESSCLSATQFLIHSPAITTGIRQMIAAYNTLSYSTKRAMLGLVYAVYPSDYVAEVKVLLQQENNPKLFAIEAAYLQKNALNAHQNAGVVLQLMHKKFPNADSIPTLLTLSAYLKHYSIRSEQMPPPIDELFAWQKAHHIKTVYSFQRWDRNFGGLAVVQFEDGHFARGQNGKILTFRQLARAASNLPYFLTNGNTPQGIFKIHGLDISRNLLIGPTPNLQTLLPFEKDALYYSDSMTQYLPPLDRYLAQLPPSWRHYAPMQETFEAGNCGRSEIIVHGATIDPTYFKEWSFYPLIPTDGCLCAAESWNPLTGKLDNSDQLNLINTFSQSSVDDGNLIVINISNDKKPVTQEEVEKMINAFELE